jgi:hypothetical protein
MLCTQCGTAGSDNARFCVKCGRGLGDASAPNQARLPATAQLVPQKSLGEAILFLCGVALVLALVWIYAQKQVEKREENQRKPAVIAAIRQRYSPSTQLLALSPDLSGAIWSAHKNPAECARWHSGATNCWVVFYRINVMPGSEAKQIECEWLISMDTMEDEPENTEARLMFVKIGF